MLGKGAKRKLFVPCDLTFGEGGPLADRTVIIEAERVKVLD